MEKIYISQRTRQAIQEERTADIKHFTLCLTGCVMTVLLLWVAFVVAYSL